MKKVLLILLIIISMLLLAACNDGELDSNEDFDNEPHVFTRDIEDEPHMNTIDINDVTYDKNKEIEDNAQSDVNEDNDSNNTSFSPEDIVIDGFWEEGEIALNEVWINGNIVRLGMTVREFLEISKLEYYTSHFYSTIDGLDEVFYNPITANKREIPIGINGAVGQTYFLLEVFAEEAANIPLWDHKIYSITNERLDHTSALDIRFFNEISPMKTTQEDIFRILGEPKLTEEIFTPGGYTGFYSYYGTKDVEISFHHDYEMEEIPFIKLRFNVTRD
jgi:hypothetical protein